jgi:glutathionyl-hydroquinone reductase
MDIRLFMTLVRFDEVYVVYFKVIIHVQRADSISHLSLFIQCNKRFLSSYHNITNYMRELYQMPVIRSVINMDHIKGHYYTSHSVLNAYSVIPAGPNTLENLLLPHDRG